MKSLSQRRKKMHRCEICGKELSEKYNLLHHMVFEHDYLGKEWQPENSIN